MKSYLVSASSDWGQLCAAPDTVQASGWHTAFARAAKLAKSRRNKKRHRRITITLSLI